MTLGRQPAHQAARGDEAPIFAAMQADKRLEAGDMEGKTVWLRVIRAIEDLLHTAPHSDGEPLH